MSISVFEKMLLILEEARVDPAAIRLQLLHRNSARWHLVQLCGSRHLHGTAKRTIIAQ